MDKCTQSLVKKQCQHIIQNRRCLSFDTAEIVLLRLGETCSDRNFRFLHSLRSIINQRKFELDWLHRLMSVTSLNLIFVPYGFYSLLLNFMYLLNFSLHC